MLLHVPTGSYMLHLRINLSVISCVLGPFHPTGALIWADGAHGSCPGALWAFHTLRKAKSITIAALTLKMGGQKMSKGNKRNMTSLPAKSSINWLGKHRKAQEEDNSRATLKSLLRYPQKNSKFKQVSKGALLTYGHPLSFAEIAHLSRNAWFKAGQPFFERMHDCQMQSVYQYIKHTALKKQLVFNVSIPNISLAESFTAQGMQRVWLLAPGIGWYVPTGQAEQVVSLVAAISSLYVPRAHLLQANKEDAPFVELQVPREQSAQVRGVVAPLAGLHFPAGQSSHTFEVSAPVFMLHVPLAQSSHAPGSEEPICSLKRPIGQATHTASGFKCRLSNHILHEKWPVIICTRQRYVAVTSQPSWSFTYNYSLHTLPILPFLKFLISIAFCNNPEASVTAAICGLHLPAAHFWQTLPFVAPATSLHVPPGQLSHCTRELSPVRLL